MSEQVNITTDEKSEASAYVGAVSTLPMEARLSLGPPNRCSTVPTIRLFLAKYNAYPCTLDCASLGNSALLHATTVINYIRDELKHDLSKDHITRLYHRQTKERYIASRLCDLSNGVMIDMSDILFNCDVQNPNKLAPDQSDDYFLIVSTATIYYLPEKDPFVSDLSDRFSKMFLLESKSCVLQMVCRNQHGYYLNGINIKRPLITDLGLHYGSSFVSIHEKIIKSLNKKEGKGIVLLHGIPGSGKYLVNMIQLISLFSRSIVIVF
jgi:hypothetical protein